MGNRLSKAPADDWIILFRSLLCELYQQFGGDCGTLDWGDGGQTAVDTVRTAFETNGLPPLTGITAQQEFEELLNDLETHINLPNATISPAVKSATQSLIDDIRGALDA
ncbi:MAG: hypothetical protein IT431_10645 [Phycisphaerales bacterium]|nr:hypothetical protein [Phycisphaerales bacterium]